MNLLIFFSIVFATIIFAIIFERIINCPALVGLSFFAIFLIVAAVLNNITYVVIAIALEILAFIVAFFVDFFRDSNFFNNNITCNNDDNSTCDCKSRNYRMRRF